MMQTRKFLVFCKQRTAMRQDASACSIQDDAWLERRYDTSDLNSGLNGAITELRREDPDCCASLLREEGFDLSGYLPAEPDPELRKNILQSPAGRRSGSLFIIPAKGEGGSSNIVAAGVRLAGKTA